MSSPLSAVVDSINALSEKIAALRRENGALAAQLAKAREWIEGAPHRAYCKYKNLNDPHCDCGRDALLAPIKERQP